MIRLNIEQQYAKLGLEIIKPQLNMHTTLPKIKIESQPAIVEIHTTPGKLEIDTTPCRYALGLKNLSDLARDLAQEGKQAVLEAIGKISEDGDRMAEFQNGDAIVELAYEINLQSDYSIEWAYKQPPLISYQKGSVEYNVIPAKLNIDFEKGDVELDFKQGKVSGYLRQQNYIRFWTSGSREGSFIDYRA